MGTPFGSPLPAISIMSRVLATLVTSTKADSTVSSISCCLQMIHRMKTSAYQTTTNNSSLKFQDISYLVYFAQTTFVRPQSPWSQMGWGNLPQGFRGSQLRCSVTHILSGHQTPGKSFSRAQRSQAQYYTFQYKPSEIIP
ncbi:hypothetical protein EI94DRAFT_1315809 [Lactarius quietus]|nr:hypothetical protein EI94DRAFT_1315809 [Lactarius quietus]